MKLIAFIAPTPAMMFSHGTHNGYVAVPPEHPLYGKDMFDDAIDALDVHGGITLSDAVIMPSEDNDIKINPKYVGKRHPLLDRAEYLTEEKNIPDDWWILGFDTCHYGDNEMIWNRPNVVSETLHLKEQLEELENSKQ